MRWLWLLSAMVVFAISCGVAGKKAPPEETVLSLLRDEAQKLKIEGENLDPSYGVTANWEIEDVQVRKLNKDESQPWGGTVRFKITSRFREPDGMTSQEEFVKNFEYGWDMVLEGWTFARGARPAGWAAGRPKYAGRRGR